MGVLPVSVLVCCLLSLPLVFLSLSLSLSLSHSLLPRGSVRFCSAVNSLVERHLLSVSCLSLSLPLVEQLPFDSTVSRTRSASLIAVLFHACFVFLLSFVSLLRFVDTTTTSSATCIRARHLAV